MADKSFDILANLEKPNPKVSSWRRNSTGNINININTRFSESNVVLSRYLSAPLASCHDSCKNGTKCDNDMRFASNPRKKQASKEAIDIQTEKKFTTMLKLPSNHKKQTTSTTTIKQVTRHDRDVKRVIPGSTEHQKSLKTKGILGSSQKSSTIQRSTKHRKSNIQKKASQQPSKQTRETKRQSKQDDTNEEHVLEKTLYAIEEHKEDSTNHKSSCFPDTMFNSSEETGLKSEQETMSIIPEKLMISTGEIVDGKLYNDSDSPRKVVVQYVIVQGKKDSTKLLESMIEETANKPLISVDVKSLIDVFERKKCYLHQNV